MTIKHQTYSLFKNLQFALCIFHFAILFLFFDALLLGQESAKFAYPFATYFNKTADTLYCLPKQKLETLMNIEEINSELISAFEKRAEVCDSALMLKGKEAENWYMKLIETGNQSKEAEIKNVRQNHRNKIKNKVDKFS